VGVEDSRGYRLQCELLAVEDDGVASVVTALVAYYDVGIACIEIGDFTLSLVAPLGAYNYQSIAHSFNFL
jgi:hypothetical protein